VKVEIKEDLDVEVRQLSWIASGDASQRRAPSSWRPGRGDPRDQGGGTLRRGDKVGLA
jgi:hypothetical protein